MRKKLFVFISAFNTAAFCLSAVSFASAFKDVPSTHWAYQAVENIYSKGYLRDFTNENFTPDGYIDKFTISRIIALVAGYSEETFSLGDYSSQNNLLLKYAEKFSKWNTPSNNQIAFLLSKGILVEEDLENFMLFSDDGSEKFRAVSREEIADFFVKLMGKSAEADSMKNSALFKDDSSITPSRKGSINYLKSINVLTGDSDGYCHPKNAVTKAEFCVLLNNVVEIIDKDKTQDNSQSSNVNNISQVTGNVSHYYKTLGIIQLKVNGEINTYRLSSGVRVSLNNESASLDAIVPGLSVNAVINNSQIIELSLFNNGNSNIQTSENSTEQTTQSEETSSNQNKDNNLCMDSSAKGTIQSISIGQSLDNECQIGILTDNNEIKYFSSNRYTVPIYSLKIGDLVEVTAGNGKISSIKFVEKNNKFVSIGYVSDVDDDKITVRTVSDDEEDFYFDENLTECFDCMTGKNIDFDDIKKFTEVYVLYEDLSSRAIDVIFVIGNF